MDPTPAHNAVTQLVQAGWRELGLRRPLAAWARWQEALRLDPSSDAARQALDQIASSSELPAAARVDRRFRTPQGEDRRRRWDDALRERDLHDLELAAETFAGLAGADPLDSAAAYNRALCLAWLGRNAEAVAALDEPIRLDADDRPEEAIGAALLAEVLRQGAGAESLADDTSHTLVLDWPEAVRGDPLDRLAGIFPIRPVPTPGAPEGLRVAELLGGPLPQPGPGLSADDLPRVRATIVAAPGHLRLSSPLAAVLSELEADLEAALGPDFRPLDRRTEPLPLHLLDTAAWQFRLPEALDPDERHRLQREGLERFYEHDWLMIPRRGLATAADRRARPDAARSPATAARAGDPESRARLEALVRLREGLAARPQVAELHGGYPFDRLRRRLGLEVTDPNAVEADDYSAMSGADLERIDPSAIDPAALVEALQAARPVSAEAAGRFALALADRDPSALLRLDFPRLAGSVFDDLVEHRGPEAALGLLDRLVALEPDPGRSGLLELLRAGFYSDIGDEDAATAHLTSLLETRPDDAETLLNAGALLGHLGEPDRAAPLLERAAEVAARDGLPGVERAARTILEHLPGDSP